MKIKIIQLTIYIIKVNDKDVKLTSGDILPKFEPVNLHESIRFVGLSQGGFQGAMLFIEHEK